jgi:replicative DNA helicase
MNKEKLIISCLVQKPELFKELVITEEHLLTDKAKLILKLFKIQYDQLKTIDMHLLDYSPINLSDSQKSDILNYLVDALDELVTFSNFAYYQEQVFKDYISRLILNEIKKFENKKITEEDLLNNIQDIGNKSLNVVENQKNEKEVYDLISSKNKNISFRFSNLSKASNIQEHDLVVIAARPGIGKTGFALNLIENLSDNYKCLYFNMEMSEKQVYQRLVGINTNIDMKYYDTPQTEHQLNKIKEGCKNIAKKKIVCYTGSQTTKSIKQKIIKNSKEEHTLVFVDYVGLIRGDFKKSSYERTTEIVKELRQISLDYNCTIFLIAQINRNSEKDKDKRPKISDLKETGELEQSATTVIMLHNDNYYKGINTDEEPIQMIIGKNRNGTTGITELIYNKTSQKFENKRRY